jgi:hypothetical protein
MTCPIQFQSLRCNGISIIEPFQAEEHMVEVVMLAKRTLFQLTIPWFLNKWAEPFIKEEKLPSMKMGKFVHLCMIIIQQYLS